MDVWSRDPGRASKEDLHGHSHLVGLAYHPLLPRSRQVQMQIVDGEPKDRQEGRSHKWAKVSGSQAGVSNGLSGLDWGGRGRWDCGLAWEQDDPRARILNMAHMEAVAGSWKSGNIALVLVFEGGFWASFYLITGLKGG